MIDDPIVAEVRRARARLMTECDNDLEKLFTRIAELQRQHAHRVISKAELDARRHQQATPPPMSG